MNWSALHGEHSGKPTQRKIGHTQAVAASENTDSTRIFHPLRRQSILDCESIRSFSTLKETFPSRVQPSCAKQEMGIFNVNSWIYNFSRLSHEH
jgi:hypothetical protein